MTSQALVMLVIPQEGGPMPLGQLLEQMPGGYLFVVILGLGALFHIGMAVFVFLDARQRRAELMPAPAWALLTLVAGLMGLLVYWLVNREAPRREPR